MNKLCIEQIFDEYRMIEVKLGPYAGDYVMARLEGRMA